MQIEPTSAQLKRLMEGDPDAPVVMLNLLRFSENATGIDEQPAPLPSPTGYSRD